MTTFEILWPKIKEEIEASLLAEIERLRRESDEMLDLQRDAMGAEIRMLGADRDRWRAIANKLAAALGVYVDLGCFPEAGEVYDAYEALRRCGGDPSGD